MRFKNVRRIGAAGVLLVCLVALPGAVAANHLPTFSIDDRDVNENDGTVTFTVTLSADPGVDSSVAYATADGSAVAGLDYVATSNTLNFTTGGPLTQTFTVDIVDNNLLHEPDENFVVNLSSASPAASVEIGDGVGSARIIDNDPKPTLALTGPATVDEAAGTATYNVAISGQSAATVSVTYATANGSASSGSDYTETTGPLSWPSGDETTRTITVPILEDALDEGDETFSVNLSGESGAVVTARSVGTTITDNDAPPSATINDVTVVEGNAPATVDAVFTVTLSAVSGREVRLPWGTAPGTAAEPDDYQPGSGTLVIAPGETTGKITVVVKGDNVFESNEQFSVLLVNPINATLADNRGQGTITNDDAAANPTVAPASVTEGNSGTSDLVFQVTLPGPRPQTTFNYRTVAGSATSSDFTEVGGAQLIFPAGSSATTLPVTITVKGDTLDENDESLTLELLNPTSGAVVASATGTIVNDDDNSKLSINDSSADEPTGGTATMKFAITLSPVSARTVTVGWATANGTAAADSDYTAGSGSVTFAPGEATKEITVAILGDTVNEPNETVLLNLSGAAGAGVADAQGQGTIIDKNAPPSLAIDDILTREGEVATFTVTLSGNTLQSVTVVAKTVDGTAKAGTEYTARRTVFTFAPGEKSKRFEVVGIDDTLSEPIETYFVELEDAGNATITKSRGTATVDASDQVTPTGRPTPPTFKPAPKAAPKKVLLPRMVLGPPTVVVGVNGFAFMTVTCVKASPIVCSGAIVLEKPGKPVVKLGTKAFTVKKGKKAKIRILLSPKALKLLKKTGMLRVRAVVLVKNSVRKNVRVVPGFVTLRATRGLMTTVLVQTVSAQKKPPAPAPKVEIIP